jgi:hypothetical protein
MLNFIKRAIVNYVQRAVISFAILIILLILTYAISDVATIEELIRYSGIAFIFALTIPFAWSILAYAAKSETSSQEQKSSGAAKVAFAMSAVALARSSKPSKVPQATSRNGGDRNISCHQRSGNKWLVTYETLHPATGWRPDSTVINTSTRSFNTWGGHIDITWI